LTFGDLVQARTAATSSRNLAADRRTAIFSTSGQTTLDFTDDRAKLHDTLLRLQPRPSLKPASPTVQTLVITCGLDPEQK